MLLSPSFLCLAIADAMPVPVRQQTQGSECKKPCLYCCVSVPFPGSLFLAICLTWQALTKTRSTLPRKPTVTPLLQGACYSPFLNGSNFWTSGIMIHEAVKEELMAQHCKHPPLLFCVVLHPGALHHMHKKATHSWTRAGSGLCLC